ncbi:hypothetical protein SB2_28500 [Methylobacterium radiotolerans]|nr:hypothetical protein SB3_06365 [Methylobacterium radiotolerans]KTS43201.1 hypothetical protein SB2_28500 [Methylobacterium radiotolerans]
MAAGARETLDLSTIDPAQLAHAAETAARVNLAAAGILGACSERSTMRATVGKIEHGQALASLALLMAFVAEHYETLLPVFLALQEGSVVAVEEAAPVRARGDERPALAVVAR